MEVLTFGLQIRGLSSTKGHWLEKLLHNSTVLTSSYKAQVHCRARNLLVAQQLPRLSAVCPSAEFNRSAIVCEALLQ